MERNSILILEKLSLLSIVIPYYDFLHNSFLVVSTLSKGTRQMLIENYTVFRRIMFKYSLTKEDILIKDLWQLRLPSDLFRFKIARYSLDNGAEDLIELINTQFYTIFSMYNLI